MALCDEFPELYFPDDEGRFIWEKKGWAGYEPEEIEEKPQDNGLLIFKSLNEAKQYAMTHPGAAFVRNPNGEGFVLKGSVPPEKQERWQKREAAKRDANMQSGKPRNAGLPWRDSDLAILIARHTQKVSIDEIANELERTQIAISAKLFNLGLILESEHQATMARFGHSIGVVS